MDLHKRERRLEVLVERSKDKPARVDTNSIAHVIKGFRPSDMCCEVKFLQDPATEAHGTRTAPASQSTALVLKAGVSILLFI